MYIWIKNIVSIHVNKIDNYKGLIWCIMHIFYQEYHKLRSMETYNMPLLKCQNQWLTFCAGRNSSSLNTLIHLHKGIKWVQELGTLKDMQN